MHPALRPVREELYRRSKYCSSSFKCCSCWDLIRHTETWKWCIFFNARKVSQTFFCAPNQSSEKTIMYEDAVCLFFFVFFLKKAVSTWSMLLCADKRQRVALELLESERVYVSHLSLLLKANISFNGSEAFSCKDKRWACRWGSTELTSVKCRILSL